MPREAVIATRMRARIDERKAQLPDLDAAIAVTQVGITTQQGTLAELMMKRTAIVMGIEADEAMLQDAAPKSARVRKVRPGTTPPTLADQIRQSPKED